MQITITSVPVQDQDVALKFYTEILGFVKKHDFPAGGAKWLTVVSPDVPEGTQLLLEPLGFEPAKVYQKALYEAGIPWTFFGVADVQAEYERLKALGVRFQSEPVTFESPTGTVHMVVFDDTCGNLIMINNQVN